MFVGFNKIFLVIWFLGLLQFSAALINGTISAEEIEVNGESVQPDYADNFPFMVEIIVRARHRCGGAIIQKNAVITAASCLTLNDTIQDISEFTLLAGNQVMNKDNQKSVQTRSIAKAVLHPGWPASDASDLAILKTSEDFEMTPWVNIVHLNYNWPEPYEVARLFGWGYTEENRHSKMLRHGWNHVYESTSCNYINVPGVVCLKDDGDGRACYGDSGGPVILDGDTPLNHTLIAIISFNPGAPRPDQEGSIDCAEYEDSIGINITYYRDYIENVIATEF